MARSHSSEEESQQESEPESQSEEETSKKAPAKSSPKAAKKGGKSGGYEASPAPVASRIEEKKDVSSPSAAPEELTKQVGPLEVEFVPHDKQPPIERAVDVVYCPNCGLPPDFCQYGPSWEKCKPWCLENFPQYYPELSGISLDDAKKKAALASEKDKEKLLPGGKKKRDASPRVTIKKLSRGGRKCVTTITGLDGFGVKNDVAAKLFKKKFACGASVVSGEGVAPDSVEIQGDFEEELIDIIEGEWKKLISRDKIELLEGGTKKKGKGR
eukprot:TRINITY_DN20649_c0_g1_i1.p1 TRINITY_DN20649_c0_g1~~TRINITY_DN20649_c0_g1_i1.p1  ORF type:complete len:270 (-),score=74.93 TRINITY_DN20649_c0_g1_i1:75-884(-)